MFAAAAMSLSSFCVVSNALRLNLFKLHDASRDRIPKDCPVSLAEEPVTIQESLSQKEENMIQTVVSVEGMMCQNCERHVKEAIEKNFEVESVSADHEAGEVVIESEKPLDWEKLKTVIADEGYEATGVKAA